MAKYNGVYSFEGDKAIFIDNNDNELEIKTKHINGEDLISLNEAEKLARWAIKNGNLKGYDLLEKVNIARIRYCK
ncbi:hypothetical protein [Clostridium ljungdahlii]|uniref:Uncharacterized protein n=1 Tax=Clostridium ljungdahlii (strain ATCC 55383 / DSM 13528 / PETC) TaxID=748727 RepID=D8GU71_CLOLD|nr:hypothetical protein [Clostridium ljungdahlii]ADK14734.1 hypothetical protein CLJU_c16700 [Clostridium ljungdahlii DSM 13528]OAA84090.1 hypothetical protein WX45_01934 [Clostridium ljungdahlii DSM 13528]